MSVIIKGMKKPNNCMLCPLVNIQLINDKGTIHQCYYNGEIIGNIKCVPDFCPLVDLLDNHGRLVDADDLLDRAKRQSGPMTGDGWDNLGVYALIERQETVVEAGEK